MSAPTDLKRAFDKVVAANTLGGSSILHDLGNSAAACIGAGDNVQDAVAYALMSFLAAHARDKGGRVVLASETQQFVADCSGLISDAVGLVETGGSDAEATRVIAELGRKRPHP